jgi:two-component system, NtrC family, sensor kinase
MTPTVLILDDSLTVRMDLAEAFSAAGFETRPCATAAEARAQWCDGDIDAVILDVRLPDGDGVDLLRELRDTPAGEHTPVLMLSTEAEVADRVRALRTGADEYIGKPYDTGYVVAKAGELIRGRAPGRVGGGHDGVPTVLVIDDSATFREVLRRSCELQGYDVIVAASGEDGLRLAATARPTAAIVDGVLPDIDGATVIRRMRLDAALRSTPCLLLTASDEKDDELRALDAGADAFVRKQEDIEVVMARLSAVLRRSQGAPSEDTTSLLSLRKVLAVGETSPYLRHLATSLRGEGYDVMLAAAGDEALEIVALQPVDCILVDLDLPDGDGDDIYRGLKAATGTRDVPLIVLTAGDDRAAMLGALTVGADDSIPRSSGADVLTARVRAQLRRKQFEDENRRVREEALRAEIEATEARAARELAETRAELVSELEAKNQELEAFSYSVSHDLKAPLRRIEGFSAILVEDHGDQLDEAGRAILGRLSAAAERMGELIEDLLGLSRVGRADLARGPVDLSAVAARVLDDLAHRDPDRAVTTDIEPGLVVDADRRLLTAVLENLLGNAWKFTARTADARISVCARTDGPERVYVIADNGPGFDMSHAARLFEPFQRLHDDTEFPGTGIGLATVRRIIERHRGRVWADAADGRGATFLFTIPPALRAPS